MHPPGRDSGREATRHVSALQVLLPGWLHAQSPSHQGSQGLEDFELYAGRGVAGRRWGKGRDWVGRGSRTLNSGVARAGGDSKGGSGVEDSRAKACEGMGQDSARLCTPHAGQTGWCNMGTFSWFPFWFPVISLLFFLFFFNSGNYIFQLSFYGNKLVRSLCVCAQLVLKASASFS